MLGAMSATQQPGRQFGWWDMFVPPEQDPREQGARHIGHPDFLWERIDGRVGR